MTYATRPRQSAHRGDRYREMEVLSAAPGALVVMVYDHLLASLTRARQAIVAQNHEARALEFGRARDAIGELLVTLDPKQWGPVAARLADLYTFFLRELATLGIDPALDRLDRVTTMVRELREAFAGIQHGVKQ